MGCCEHQTDSLSKYYGIAFFFFFFPREPKKQTKGVEMEELLHPILRQHKVVVFSKTYCPHCYKVKQLFCSLGVEPLVLELDKIEKGAEIQQALIAPTGNHFVPKIWIAGLWFDAEKLFKFYAEGHLIPYLKSVGILIIT